VYKRQQLSGHRISLKASRNIVPGFQLKPVLCSMKMMT